MSVKITAANLKAQISKGPVVVDFWASWCSPCMMMEPVIERLSKKYEGRVAFGKANVDEEPAVSSKYNIMSIPTFILFKSGAPVEAVVGAVPEAQLERLISHGLRAASG